MKTKAFWITASLLALPAQSTAGLIDQYQFEGNLFDNTENGFNLTAGGTFTYVPDRFGNESSAVQLITAASNGTFFLGQGPNLAYRSSSVAFWVREDLAGDDFVGSWVFGLGHSAGTGGSLGQDMHISLGSDTIRYSFFYYDLDSPTQLTAFQWHHIAGTFDYSTGRRHLYLDGTLLASDTTSIPFSGGTSLKMGSQGISLDDFRLYDHALMAAEVSRLYSEEMPAVPDSVSVAAAFALGWAALVSLYHGRKGRDGISSGAHCDN